ncbi:MAG: STAS domain-containing protein [Deltaproteobacteria bacterium]|nr:STAS domain-containing protein [Deltaproteobacteria bacterium]
MLINVKQQGDVAILKLQGNLDADSVAHFKKTAYELADGGKNCMVLDCSALDFVDSMGLGALISLLRRLRTGKGDLKIAALSNDVRSVFEITRLHRLFEITPDWESACGKF